MAEHTSDRLSRSVLLAALCSGFGAYMLYELTNASGFFWGDAGEFMAVSKTLGIGHAYGHPLFWLMGRVSMIIAPNHPAAAMNCLTALFSALTCVIVFLLASQWMESTQSLSKRLIAAISVTALFATGYTFWTQASYTEVYNVQAFFIALSLLLFDNYCKKAYQNQFLYASAFFLGIAVTLGMYVSILLVIPLTFFIIKRKDNPFQIRALLVSGVFFILGLSLWLYLPIRSALDPPFQYQSIHSFSNLINYLRRSMYGTSNLAGTAGVKYVMHESPRILYHNLGLFSLFLLAFAIPGMRKRSFHSILLYGYLAAILIFYLVAVFFLPRTLTFVQMVGMEVYYIPLFMLCVPFFAIGANYALHFLKGYRALILILPPIISLLFNVPKINISHKKHADLFKEYLIETLPQDAQVYPRSDGIWHPIFYAVLVEGTASDYHVLADKITEKAYADTVNSTNQWDRFFEIDNLFIHSANDLNRFNLAGPLVVTNADSNVINTMEDRFISQFAFENSEIPNLNIMDRFSLGIIWMNRGAYWYNLYNKASDDTTLKKEAWKNSLFAYHRAYLLDDFSYLGAFTSGMLSQMVLKSGLIQEAEDFAIQSNRIHPDSRQAWLTRYQIALRKRSYENAIKYLKKLIDVPPFNPHDHLELAQIYIILKQKDKAITSYLKGIQAGAKPDPGLKSILGLK